MRTIDHIVIHCSATREDCSLPVEELEKAHRRRGFRGIGYHYYIRRDGTTLNTRPLELIGAHAKGHQCSFDRPFAMKAAWMLGGVQRIPAHRNSVAPCTCWWRNC